MSKQKDTITDVEWFDIKSKLKKENVLTIIIGARGIGKTYSAKELVVSEFIENENTFILLKRFVNEFDEIAKSFFNDNKYANRITYQRLNFYFDVNWETEPDDPNHQPDLKPFGHCVALNRASKSKGVAYPDTKYFLWDECFDTSAGTISNEVDKLFDVMETFGRFNDYHVIALANAVHKGYIPLLDELGIRRHVNEIGVPYKDKSRGIYFEYVENSPSYMEKKKKTKLGRLSKGTRWHEAMFDNKIQDADYQRLVDPTLAKNVPNVMAIKDQDYFYNFSKQKRNNKTIYVVRRWSTPINVQADWIFQIDGTAGLPKLTNLKKQKLQRMIEKDILRAIDMPSAKWIKELTTGKVDD